MPAKAARLDRFLWQYPEHSTAPWWPYAPRLPRARRARARAQGPALCLDVNTDKPEPEPLDPNDLIDESDETWPSAKRRRPIVG